MAITTLDGVIAGFMPPTPIFKVGASMPSIGSGRMYTPWYVGGNPGASVATVVGVNGEACTPALGSVGSRLPRTNPATLNAYLGRLSINSSGTGVFVLIDRLWQNSGLSTTVTTAQAIAPAALPARSGDGTINGANIMAGLEWSVVAGAGAPAVNLTYTNQAGLAGQTASLTGLTAAPVGTIEPFTLAPGDTGVRSVQSFIQSATRTSGAFHLILYRVLAMVEIASSNTGNAIDAITSGMPRIFNDSVLQSTWQPISSTAVTLMGSYVETQG